MVGLIPLFAVETLEPELLERCRLQDAACDWFLENRPDLTDNVACMQTPGHGERRLLSVVDARSPAARAGVHARRERVPLAVRHPRALALSPATHPYVLPVDGHEHRVDYEPASRPPGCSAATRTGAARSGSRSTTC